MAICWRCNEECCGVPSGQSPVRPLHFTGLSATEVRAGEQDEINLR